LTSGSTYLAAGGQRESFNADADEAPLNDTFTTMFNLVGQGSAPNFKEKAVVHLTINANGEATADFVHFSSECTG
jgi:hypothetical protein